MGTARRSAVISNTRRGGEGINKKVVVVTRDFPHGEPEQVVLCDEFPLGGERLRVVVGNHQFLGLVVNEGLVNEGSVRNYKMGLIYNGSNSRSDCNCRTGI